MKIVLVVGILFFINMTAMQDEQPKKADENFKQLNPQSSRGVWSMSKNEETMIALLQQIQMQQETLIKGHVDLKKDVQEIKGALDVLLYTAQYQESKEESRQKVEQS